MTALAHTLPAEREQCSARNPAQPGYYTAAGRSAAARSGCAWGDKRAREKWAVPAVSVVIPAHNAEKHICETLDSVLAQTYRDFEVIVVDDGSADATQELVRAYGPRVRLVTQKHGGPSAARNRGIREASGRFIAFVDSDDLWLPEKLGEQVSRFDHEGRVGLVYCQVDRMTAEGQPIATHHPPLPKGRVFLELLERNHCWTSGVIVRREALEKCGLFDEHMVWAEDWHLWLRIARQYEFDVVERVLALHRVHDASLTRRLEDAYLGARHVLDTALRLEGGAAARRAARRGRHRLERNYGLLWLGMAQVRRARRRLWQALGRRLCDPHAAAGIVATFLPEPVRIPLLRAWKRLAPWVPWDKHGRYSRPAPRPHGIAR